jgi:hypothetical protein
MSENPIVKEKKAKVTKPKYDGPSCSVCNKPLTDPESIKHGIGPLCRANGWTKEKVAEKMATLKKEEVPADWVKLAEVDKACRLNKIPVARMVRAIGGDRGMSDPVTKEWQVIYVGRSRYLSAWCLSEAGLNVLRDKYLGQPAPEKKARVKKVKLDANGNPIVAVKKEKKAIPEDAVKKPLLGNIWGNKQ